MSTHELKAGDRVRVKAGCRVPGDQAGDRGTVLRAAAVTNPNGTRYYVVAMDKDDGSTTFIFAEDEIEPDV